MKNEQRLLVDFQQFPAQLVKLLDDCKRVAPAFSASCSVAPSPAHGGHHNRGADAHAPLNLGGGNNFSTQNPNLSFVSGVALTTFLLPHLAGFPD